MSRQFRDHQESQLGYSDSHDPADCDDPAAVEEFYRQMEREMGADLASMSPPTPPTDAEIENMCRDAGYDKPPF